MKKPIRILSPEMGILSEIDNYESMFFTRSWSEIGQIEVVINRYMKHADTLRLNNLIIVDKNFEDTFIIKHREIQLDSEGKITENWLIKGYSLSYIMSTLITIPPVGIAYDVVRGSYETVMQHYVGANFINPIDPSRKIPNFSLGVDKNLGNSIIYSSRYKNIAEELSTLSSVSGLGWLVYLDVESKGYVFDVKEGLDRSVNQNENSPVIFSPRFDTVKSLHYTESELNYKNVAIVAGQGEGAERRIIEVGNASGFNRNEVFVDARDIAEVDNNEIPIPEYQIKQEMTERGQQRLNELGQEFFLEAELLTPITRTEYEIEQEFLYTQQTIETVKTTTKEMSTFNYKTDYDLGDIVTIQSRDWGFTRDARITEIKEIYETDGFALEATFGYSKPTIIQKIKQELTQMSGEVRR